MSHAYSTKSNAARAARKQGVEVCPENLVQLEGGWAYVTKMVEVESKGIQRPKATTLCGQVWSWLDSTGNQEVKEVRAGAEAKGWNPNNAQVELYRWRKYNGVASHHRSA